MKIKKSRLVVIFAVAIGVIIWLALSMTSGQVTVEEREYQPNELNQAMEDLGYAVSVPSYVPGSYQLDRILVTQFPPRDSTPKELAFLYKNQESESYDVVAKRLMRPFEDEVDIQIFPTDRRSTVKVNGSVGTVLRTDISGSESLRMLYYQEPDRMYQINTENRNAHSLAEAEMVRILESLD